MSEKILSKKRDEIVFLQSMRLLSFVFAVLLSLALLAGCANPKYPHWFPRLHPLFAGLDESEMTPAAKAALAEAKVDFQRARGGQEPKYAQYVETVPYTRSDIYEGRGYRLTIVHKRTVNGHWDGPSIVLDGIITGGKLFNYDEINVDED